MYVAVADDNVADDDNDNDNDNVHHQYMINMGIIYLSKHI